MDIIQIIIEMILFVLLVVQGLYIRNYLPSYFGEKGKNLATKEDIGDITRRIEEIRAGYTYNLERQRVQFGLMRAQMQMFASSQFEYYTHLWGRLQD